MSDVQGVEKKKVQSRYGYKGLTMVDWQRLLKYLTVICF